MRYINSAGGSVVFGWRGTRQQALVVQVLVLASPQPRPQCSEADYNYVIWGQLCNVRLRKLGANKFSTFGAGPKVFRFIDHWMTNHSTL